MITTDWTYVGNWRKSNNKKNGDQESIETTTLKALTATDKTRHKSSRWISKFINLRNQKRLVKIAINLLKVCKTEKKNLKSSITEDET